MAIRTWTIVLAFTLPACGPPPVDDWGIEGTLAPTPPLGKEDSAGRPGLAVATDTSDTQVWTARNQWEDRDTAAARADGPAWGRDSGLNWDEKYARWIASLAKVDGSNTFEVTTPFGTTLPAPSLECAEASIFLRALFASWYELPFFLEAIDERGQRVYFGHFGVRTAAGRYAKMPAFATRYHDYTRSWQPGQSWPSDSILRGRGIAGGSDDQPAIAPDARFGAYLDQALLNKRAGYLIILLLDYFGSMNLADSANTFNLRPEAVREGDSLVKREQRKGTGHTLVVKRVTKNDTGTLSAELVYGSMPRIQPFWQDEVASKTDFTSDEAGGRGSGSDGPYWRLGGGLKRWRVAKNVRGYWTNTWMRADEASWVNDHDQEGISSRPERFQSLLGEVPPAEKRDSLLRVIADKRDHLRSYPASCAAREERENAFQALYALAPKLGATPADIDRQYRQLEDYVFARLTYPHSKTCCWNTTTAKMAQIILDYAADEQQRAGACVPPTPFRAQAGGYAPWQAFADATGRAADWRAWSEDEPCAQRGTQDDELAEFSSTPWCSLGR